jgi:tetratricopeptide (TPR) repeat protein
MARQVEIERGNYFEDVNMGGGDFVNGDKVAGDKVAGDKASRDIVKNYYPTPPAAQQIYRSSLPSQSFFFGRQQELAAIADALAPDSRGWGVLIDGPGGIGKTALAVRAGHLAPETDYPFKLFLSAKQRELTPSGEQKLEDFMLPNYLALLNELACELGQPEIGKTEPAERANAVRRALIGQKALLVIDNLETFEERERLRLYQFLNRLPPGCKAILTSRRRTDIDARIVRLERLALDEALELLAALAQNNRHLARTTEAERRQLYEQTHGNPLLLRWVVGQLGRPGSQCRTLAEASAFIEKALPANDPLEYIFGDLIETFGKSETAVLAALSHFTQPAKVEWIAELARLSRPAAQTALEDLAERAILVADPELSQFYLPPLAAVYLRRARPQAVTQTGKRLAERALALALENGGRKYERFPQLEAAWPQVAAALPLFLQGENARLQRLCETLDTFMEFSGHWDEWLALSQQAEAKALAAGDLDNAGWRAYHAGWAHYRRGQPQAVLACAGRCLDHWQQARANVKRQSAAIQMRGRGHQLQKDYPAAVAAFQEALALDRTVGHESQDVAIGLNDLAGVEQLSGDYAAAEGHYQEAMRIAQKLGQREGVAIYTGNLAALALHRQDWPRAEALARQALELAEAIRRIQLVGSSCQRLAQALARQGRPAEGLPYARRAIEIFTRLDVADGLEEAREALAECEKGSE